MKITRITALALALLMSALTLLSCGKKEPMQKTYYEYFDTVSTVYSYANDSEESFAQNCELVQKSLEKYHRLFDIYYEYPEMNNLRTVNKNAGIAPVKVDRELIDFILYAKEMYTLTGGEMNIAMGSVLSLWHACRESALSEPSGASIPTDAQLEEAEKHISIDCIVVDTEASTLYISDSNVRIDVGALGKGYATEKTAKHLENKGVTSYVLDIGGNLRTIGAKPNGDGWVTGITDPNNKDGDFALKIDIKNISCVTSGNYERYFTVNGKRYHHIIDKDTLYPAEYFASVTVLCPDSGLADALSTALFCMSYEDGLALAQMADADVIWIYQSGEVRMTDGARKLVVND